MIPTKPYANQKGSVLIIVMMLFVVISLSISLGLIAPVLRATRIAANNLHSKRSYFIAESGVEDVLYRLRNSMDVSSSEVLVLGSVETTTAVTDINGTQKEINAIGDSLNRARKISMIVEQGDGVAFNYGLQVGRGGMSLEGSSGVNGSVYANGDIYGSSSSFITGSAIAANTESLIADQTNGVAGTPPSTIVFGNAASTQDLAQSFTVTEEIPLNKVQFYIKKTGNPSNATVYIMTNSGSSPSTTYLATGTLSASTVTTSYGWVNSVFSTNPVLQAGVIYWVVVDASTSSSNYYTIGANTNGYANGTAKTGQRGGTWNATSPSTLDAYFNIYLGGLTSTIYGDSQYNQLHVGTSGSGIAHAHTVNATNATGIIYCETGTANNKTCNTSLGDPSPQDWPISDSNIDAWKEDALEGGTTTGDVVVNGTQAVSLGPKKIVGDLDVSGSGVLTVTGTLWVTGNITVSGFGKIKLSSAYGSSSGIIIADGKMNIAGSSPITGSGTVGSYILAISLSDCPTSSSCSGANAIDISGAAGAVVLIAQNGTINFTGSASAKQATGYRITLTGATTVTYESGLANINFSSGPSGSWTIASWKETQ
jgi:hypothetical protein